VIGDAVRGVGQRFVQMQQRLRQAVEAGRPRASLGNGGQARQAVCIAVIEHHREIESAPCAEIAPVGAHQHLVEPYDAVAALAALLAHARSQSHGLQHAAAMQHADARIEDAGAARPEDEFRLGARACARQRDLAQHRRVELIGLVHDDLQRVRVTVLRQLVRGKGRRGAVPDLVVARSDAHAQQHRLAAHVAVADRFERAVARLAQAALLQVARRQLLVVGPRAAGRLPRPCGGRTCGGWRRGGWRYGGWPCGRRRRARRADRAQSRARLRKRRVPLYRLAGRRAAGWRRRLPGPQSETPLRKVEVALHRPAGRRAVGWRRRLRLHGGARSGGARRRFGRSRRGSLSCRRTLADFDQACPQPRDVTRPHRLHQRDVEWTSGRHPFGETHRRSGQPLGGRRRHDDDAVGLHAGGERANERRRAGGRVGADSGDDDECASRRRSGLEHARERARKRPAEREHFDVRRPPRRGDEACAARRPRILPLARGEALAERIVGQRRDGEGPAPLGRPLGLPGCMRVHAGQIRRAVRQHLDEVECLPLVAERVDCSEPNRRLAGRERLPRVGQMRCRRPLAQFRRWHGAGGGRDRRSPGEQAMRCARSRCSRFQRCDEPRYRRVRFVRGTIECRQHAERGQRSDEALVVDAETPRTEVPAIHRARTQPSACIGAGSPGAGASASFARVRSAASHSA